MLKLLKFKTTDFRSIDNSGWVDVQDVTAFVGINESGKTNLLLSLWKLRPARGGEIDPIADYPRDKYNAMRSLETPPVFIRARFQVPAPLAERISDLTGFDSEELDEVEIGRRYNKGYIWSFPNCVVSREVESAQVKEAIEASIQELEQVEPFRSEGDLKDRMLSALAAARDGVGAGEVRETGITAIQESFSIDRADQAKTSKIGPVFDGASSRLDDLIKEICRPGPTLVDGVWDIVLAAVPKFVFYSTYGNLDSEIFLPHVIENMEREDLGEKEEAKTRTMKVLFEFVDLSPTEILELGTEIEPQNATEEEIEADARKKKEREILLTSASTQLTNKFREWWKQGNYRFRFNADGNHFRIWVSDDQRPEEIELEGRSTGLQWFFSFYLVFLVESNDEHEGTILLLDEAGLSLHPLAQRDLSTFFDGLPNQILYTTHSPFLVEPDALDRVRSVFTNEVGRTVVSSDLRANTQNESAKNSVYAVHVALGLSVSDTFLLGCLPVIVEGVSDQRYLTAVKNYLIGAGKIAPNKDIVFLPAGGTGTKGISAVVSVVTAREEELPFVLVDSDSAGNSLKTRLLSGLYRGHEDRIKQIADYGLFENSEIEDLMPSIDLANIVTRYLPRPAGSDEDFHEVVDSALPIIPQIEKYAADHEIELTLGWKVEVATLFKTRIDRIEVPGDVEERWTSVFQDIVGSQ